MIMIQSGNYEFSNESWGKDCFSGFSKADIGSFKLLEPRQYKNDSIHSEIIPTLKLARFFTTYAMGKKRVNFKIGIIFGWMESFLFCLCSRWYNCKLFLDWHVINCPSLLRFKLQSFLHIAHFLFHLEHFSLMFPRQEQEQQQQQSYF